MGNPWEQAWLAANNDDYDLYAELDNQQRLQVFKDYYEQLGITIHKVEQTYPYDAVCEACTCPRGDRLHIQIAKENVQQMLELDFKLQ